MTSFSNVSDETALPLRCLLRMVDQYGEQAGPDGWRSTFPYSALSSSVRILGYYGLVEINESESFGRVVVFRFTEGALDWAYERIVLTND